VETLAHLGVSCVTLANNHALDFEAEGLLDTLALLDEAEIAHVGAGPDVPAARSPAVLEAAGLRLAVIGATDHPEEFAATAERPGVAFADLRRETPRWLREAVRETPADAVLVTPHWGPNMTADPVTHVRRAADDLVAAGATLVAGHSAHVVHGVRGPVLFDVGDFLDDYAVDPVLRNDLSMLFLVTVGRLGPVRLEAVPLRLEYCFTRLADGEEAAWIRTRFREACAELGTEAVEHDGRVVVEWGPGEA
jgi:poly-gamma-glutamate synthesis protein (capsule biosynthesis protein)